jgi:hypothetical protein
MLIILMSQLETGCVVVKLWAIVDVSIDKVEDNIDKSLVKCRKRPSGSIIEDKSNGHCKVCNSSNSNSNLFPFLLHNVWSIIWTHMNLFFFIQFM